MLQKTCRNDKIVSNTVSEKGVMFLEYRLSPREEAIETLENYLAVNEFDANTKLPSERDLCQQWGLNRTTLRLAISDMVEQGSLYRIKGKGTYVSPTKLMRNIVGVSSFTKEIRQEGIPLVTYIIDLSVVEATKQVSRNLQIPLGEKVCEYTRLRTIRSIPCTIETLYISQSCCPDIMQYITNQSSMTSIYDEIYGIQLVSGEEHISVTYVSEEEGDLLEVPEGTPVFFTSGITKTADGAVVEYYKSLFRADCLRFVSTIDKSECKELHGE